MKIFYLFFINIISGGSSSKEEKSQHFYEKESYMRYVQDGNCKKLNLTVRSSIRNLSFYCHDNIFSFLYPGLDIVDYGAMYNIIVFYHYFLLETLDSPLIDKYRNRFSLFYSNACKKISGVGDCFYKTGHMNYYWMIHNESLLPSDAKAGLIFLGDIIEIAISAETFGYYHKSSSTNLDEKRRFISQSLDDFFNLEDYFLMVMSCHNFPSEWKRQAIFPDLILKLEGLKCGLKEKFSEKKLIPCSNDAFCLKESDEKYIYLKKLYYTLFSLMGCSNLDDSLSKKHFNVFLYLCESFFCSQYYINEKKREVMMDPNNMIYPHGYYAVKD